VQAPVLRHRMHPTELMWLHMMPVTAHSMAIHVTHQAQRAFCKKSEERLRRRRASPSMAYC
jgi:hypothetical protein